MFYLASEGVTLSLVLHSDNPLILTLFPSSLLHYITMHLMTPSNYCMDPNPVLTVAVAGTQTK